MRAVASGMEQEFVALDVQLSDEAAVPSTVGHVELLEVLCLARRKSGRDSRTALPEPSHGERLPATQPPKLERERMT